MLPWLILSPFIGGVLCWQSERLNSKIPYWIALLTVGIILILSLIILKQGEYFVAPITLNTMPIWQKEYCMNWIPRFGINIRLAIDGLSLLMIILTSILAMLAILCSWYDIQKHPGIFYFSLLLILSSVIGIFLAIDMFLFFFFWEIMIIPIYFLIFLTKKTSTNIKINISIANKFFIYNQIGGLVMLLSIISMVIIHYDTSGIITFNYNELLYTPIPKKLEYFIMLGFFFSFAIKLPLVPLHNWLPDTHDQISTTGSVDLIGLLPKIATYGLLRFNIPLFPYTSHCFSSIAIWIGVISIIYAAWVAFSQNDIKRLTAYMNISHMGFTLIAIYSGDKLAYIGLIIQMIAHSLSIAGIFIICGQLYNRLHTFNMNIIQGLWNRINFIPALLIFFIFATIGIPGTGNFIGEITIFIGSFSKAPIPTTIAILSLILSSIYSLIMIKRTCFGLNKSVKLMQNINVFELSVLCIPMVLIISLGLFPQPIINMSTIAINYIHNFYL